MSKKPRAMINDVPVWCAHDHIVDCVELKPNPKNPNTHPNKQIQLLGKIIKGQGWRMPITVSKRSGFIVKGHGRLEAAFAAGIEKAPVDYQDYENEAAEHADMVADNRLAELAKTDSVLMESILSELKTTDVDIELTGFDENELEAMLIEDYPENAVGEPKENPAEMIIRFERPSDFKKIENELRQVMKDKNVGVSIRCGEA